MAKRRPKKQTPKSKSITTYLKPLGQPGRVIKIEGIKDIYKILDADSLDHLVLELEISLIIWVSATGDLSDQNVNFTTRTHTHGSFTGVQSFGFPIYGNALIQKTDPETGEAASLSPSDLTFIKSMIGELDLNPRYRSNPDPIDPQDLEKTAASMAWTLNDELWETTPEHRKAGWRTVAKETIEAMMLPSKEKRRALDKISEKIELLQEDPKRLRNPDFSRPPTEQQIKQKAQEYLKIMRDLPLICQFDNNEKIVKLCTEILPTLQDLIQWTDDYDPETRKRLLPGYKKDDLIKLLRAILTDRDWSYWCNS